MIGKRPLIDTIPMPACPVCGSTERTHMATGYDYEYESCGNAWLVWTCQACSHAWLDPRPADSTLPTIYPSNYYSYDYEKRINPIAVWGKRWLDRRKFSKLLSHLQRPFESYLDVGCSTGRFLELAQSLGAQPDRTSGIELDAELVRALRERGLNAECSRVEDSEMLRNEKFDLITMFHVIEHVSDPRDVISRLAQSLNPGGVLALETPNLQSLDARLFRAGLWGGYHFPRHWHIFTPVSLTKAMRDCGLEITGISYQTGHSFWLFSFHHFLKYKTKSFAWLAPAVHPLRSLPALLAITAFDTARTALGFRTSAMLVTARKPLTS